jgi:hypothetical protein
VYLAVIECVFRQIDVGEDVDYTNMPHGLYLRGIPSLIATPQKLRAHVLVLLE